MTTINPQAMTPDDLWFALQDIKDARVKVDMTDLVGRTQIVGELIAVARRRDHGADINLVVLTDIGDEWLLPLAAVTIHSIRRA